MTTISAVILAGGRGQRMGGVDKGLQRWRGMALYQWVLARLRPQVDDIRINANRNFAEYQASGLPVFADKLADFQGPLSGMLSALESATSDFVLFVPCDSPLLPHDLALRLVAAVKNNHARAAFCHDGERAQPIFCLLSSELKNELAAFLTAGERKILHFLQQQHACAVDFSDQKQAFRNFNYLLDLQME